MLPSPDIFACAKLYDITKYQGGHIRRLHWHNIHNKFNMNSLIGSKFKKGHCILCSVVHGADVSEESYASLIAVWCIGHESDEFSRFR